MVGTLRFAHPTIKIDLGASHMAFKNFKLETDADGIALVTWEFPVAR